MYACRNIFVDVSNSKLFVHADSVKEYGAIWEIRKDIYGNEIFDHKSYYYFAEVDNDISSMQLDNYEKELGFHLEFVEPNKAYEVNMRLSKNKEGSFLIRESYVLKMLLDKDKCAIL